MWGAAISAAQTESAVYKDGKGPSIWDDFSTTRRGIFNKRPLIKHGHRISDSCDFYSHYEEDILKLKYLGFKHFRFSISWPRVMPDGIHVNEAGFDFYKRVTDCCIRYGIEPWITLYHWDLPSALQKQGGWANRRIIDWFEHFSEACIRRLPEVKKWIILNEPSVFVGAGYLFGKHAPGIKSLNAFFPAAHHAMLTLAHTYKHLKNINPSLHIGSSFSFTHIEPFDNSAKEIKAAETADLLINRFLFEPHLGLGYPAGMPPVLSGILKYIQKGDEDRLAAGLDFTGIQTYTCEVFRHNALNPMFRLRHIPADKRTLLLTAMNWEVAPQSLYHCVMKVHAYGTGKPIYITENGVAYRDNPVFGKVADTARTEYFKAHIAELFRAIQAGADVGAYFVWSLLDNFEWAEGYEPRFGLIYVDFQSKERIIKDSGYWFRQLLADI